MQRLRHFPQHGIAHGMAQRIVDGFEIVHIHKQEAALARRDRVLAIQGVFAIVQEHFAAHHPGNRVHPPHVFQVRKIMIDDEQANRQEKAQRKRGE